MSDSTASLQRKISGAGDLQSVVRTMKAVAASSIGQYEQSVRALTDYYRTVELGLAACFRQNRQHPSIEERKRIRANTIIAVIFGSDQGLVGQFNDVVTDYAVRVLADLPEKPDVWAVGERVHVRLADAGLQLKRLFAVPSSVKSITPLVGQILIESEKHHHQDEIIELHLIYNRPTSGAHYTPFSQRLLPLDEHREYLFVSLFRACTESLASENASRLAAMQRADKNITELLVDLKGTFHRLRQSGIDEELFDVISGFEALGK